MNLLQIAILVFITIETLNILILYFNPTFKYGNSVGVFKAYEESKKDESSHAFIRYLVNWVAGTKLMFIALGVVIALFGNYNTQLYAVIALVFSILTFYFRLFPMIKSMDNKNQLTTKGYSKTLNFMILSFLAMFITVILIELI